MFALLNCDPPGSLGVARDPERGAVWQYTKPVGDKRCESHGIAVGGQKYVFQDNQTYYFGWWSKYSSLADDNANFQWKSYGTGMTQDYPFVISLLGGRTTVWQRQPASTGRTVWSSAPLEVCTPTT